MYRIRLASGEQAVFKTVEELAAAVASGVVSPTAEVFHKAANRWLPINTHPDYRAVVSDTRPALPPLPLDSPLPQRHTPPTRKSDAALELDKLEPQRAEPAEPDEPDTRPVESLELLPAYDQDSGPSHAVVPVPQEVPDFVALSELESQPLAGPDFVRPGRPTALIALTGGGLVAAAAIAAILLTRGAGKGQRESTSGPQGLPSAVVAPPADSGPPAMAPSPPARPTATTAPPAQAAPRLRVDTVAVDFAAPSKPLAPVRRERSPAPAPAPAPSVTSRLGTSVNRTQTYYEAYADARAEMDESLAYVEFRRVFAATRFTTPDSIRAARRMISAAGNILRVYRGREVMLEQTYRPGQPEGKGSLREPFEVAEASRVLLSDVDSLFAILVSQEGELRYRDNLLQFQNPSAARAYNEVRRRILQTLTYLGDPAEAADRVTMPRLLRGIGADRPPPGR